MSKRAPVHGYEVGYGKPPKATQFKTGQSGNPKGRPKGTNNLKTDLVEELGEHITLSEGGKSKRLSKQRALVKSLTARAIKGDASAMRTLLNLMLKVLDIAEGDEAELPLSEEELAILANFEKRILDKAKSKPPRSDEDNVDSVEGGGKNDSSRPQAT
jgi:hypothetical protein